MDPRVELLVEAGCLVGVVVLAAASTPVLAGWRWGGAMWLRSGAAVLFALLFLFINPTGASDPFPVVVGASAFAAVLLGLLLALTLGWRFRHGARAVRLDQQNARIVGNLGLFAALAVAALACVAILAVGTGQALLDEAHYRAAPDCGTTSASSCKTQAQATVIRTWAKSSSPPYDLELAIGGKTQTIEIQAAYAVWQTLKAGDVVEVTSWNGKITEVFRPGAEAMQTVDGPGINLVILITLLAACVLLLLVFSAWGLIYFLRWRLGMRSVIVSDSAA